MLLAGSEQICEKGPNSDFASGKVVLSYPTQTTTVTGYFSYSGFAVFDIGPVNAAVFDYVSAVRAVVVTVIDQPPIYPERSGVPDAG